MLTLVGSLLVVNAPTLEISTGVASPACASVRVETLSLLCGQDDSKQYSNYEDLVGQLSPGFLRNFGV